MTGLFLVRPVVGQVGPTVVVRAAGEQCARRIAVEQAGAEGTVYWRDPAQTEVRPITSAGATGVVLRRD